MDVNNWLRGNLPTGLRKLDTAKPGAYARFMEELGAAKDQLAIGRSLHCGLVPPRMLRKLREDELVGKGLPPDLIAERLGEHDSVVPRLEEWMRNCALESYRVIGVAEALAETISRDPESFQKLLDNTREETHRFSVAPVASEQYHALAGGVRKIIGHSFNSATVMDTVRICLWTDDGIFYEDCPAKARELCLYIEERMAGSHAFPEKGGRPSPGGRLNARDTFIETMKRLTEL